MRRRRILAFVLAMQLAFTSVMQVNAEKTNENTSGYETEITQVANLGEKDTGTNVKDAGEASAQSTSVTRGGLIITGGTEGVDWTYGDVTYYVQGYGNAEGHTGHYVPPTSGGQVACTLKAITVKTSTPITISTAGKTVSDSIYINPGTKADVTLDNVVITSYLPINIPTNQANPTFLHLTLADGSVNTLTANQHATYQFPGIRCGEGSYLTIDDARRNVDKDGEEVLPEQGRISRDAVLQDGTVVKKGDRLTMLDSENCGSLTVYGGYRASAIGGAALENSGNMTFNGGNLVVCAYGEGDSSWGAGAGIGGGHAGGGTTMTFNGGKINALGSYHGAGIGGGCTYTGSMSWIATTYKLTDAIMCYTPSSTIAGDININGGYLISRGCTHSNAFGQGCGGSNSGKTIKITGGTLLPTSVSGWYDIGGLGGDVIVTGGSIRLSGNNKYQSSSNDGSAWGNVEKTIKVFMTKIDLSGEAWSVDKYVESLQVTMGGEVFDYGLPAAVDDSGCLYLWLPNSGNSQEVRAVLSVLDEDGEAIEMEPFFITNATNGSNLKRYVGFEVKDEVFSTLEKVYDGLAIGTNDITNLGMKSKEETPKEINDNSKIVYTAQRLDEDGKEINEKETSGLPIDAGTWQITMTSTQYATTYPFSNSYWGHRGYYKSVEILRAKSETKVSYEQIVDDKLADKVIKLSALVKPADDEAKTCAAPTGKVQFYVNGVAVGESVELVESNRTEDGYKYSTAVYNWIPSSEDVVDFDESYEITAKYIGDVHGVNFKSSEGTDEKKMEIIPIDQDNDIVVKDVTDAANPEPVTDKKVVKNFADGGCKLQGDGGNSSKDFVYSSSDPEVAEIDSKTGEIIFKDFGEVKITVTKPGNVAYEDKTEEVTLIILPENPTGDDVEVTKTGENLSDPEEPAQVNDVISYTITVENKLRGSLWKNVVINDRMPEGLELDENSLSLVGPDGEIVDLDGSYYNNESRLLSVPVGDIRGGQKYSLTFEVKVTSDAVETEDGEPKDIGNLAEVEGEDPEGEKVIGNTSEPVYPSDENMPENGGVLWADPEPEIEKTAENITDPEKTVQVNDVVEYSIKVENKLAGSLWKNVVIKDKIPEGMELIKDSIYLTKPDGTVEHISYDHYNTKTRLLSVSAGDVYGEQTYLLKFRVTIESEAVGEDIGNKAEVEGENPKGDEVTAGTPEPVYPSESDKPSNGGALWGDPAPSLEKTAENNDRTDGSVVVEDRITYTIKVENLKKGSCWTNVAIRDRLPEGLLLDKDSMNLTKPNGEKIHVDASAYQEAERMISVYVGDVYGGEKYVLTFDVIITVGAVGKDIGNEAVAIGGKPSDGGNHGGSGGSSDSGDGSGNGSGGSGSWGPVNPGGWSGGYTTGGYEPGSPYYPEDDPFDHLSDGTGTGTDKPVYPWSNGDEGEPTPVTPSNPEPELEKTVENETHPDGNTKEEDILTYEIDLSNPKIGSLWRNVMIFDYLPDELELDLDSMTLQHPDGHITKVNARVYDVVTHMIKVPIKELWGGETYILRYKVKVVLNEEKTEKEEIVNRAEATGENPDGTPVNADSKPSSSVAIKYPVVEKQEEPKDEVKEEPKDEIKEEPKDEIKEEPKDEIKEEPKDEIKEEPKKDEVQVTPNTGDRSSVGLYLGIMLLCICLFILGEKRNLKMK